MQTGLSIDRQVDAQAAQVSMAISDLDAPPGLVTWQQLHAWSWPQIGGPQQWCFLSDHQVGFVTMRGRLYLSAQPDVYPLIGAAIGGRYQGGWRRQTKTASSSRSMVMLHLLAP
jgi:hypothetical protein